MASRAARGGRGSARRCSPGAWRPAPDRCPTAAAGGGARTPPASRPWRRWSRAAGPWGAGSCSAHGGSPRRRPPLGGAVEQRPHPFASARLARGEREVAAVAVHVLAEQRDLGDAVVRRALDLLDDVVERSADLLASHRGDDAEGAAVVAADLDRDPPGPGHLPAHRQGRGEGVVVLRDGLLEDLDDRVAGVPSLVEQVGGAVHVVGAEHHVDVGGPLGDGVAVLLGQAAGDHDLHPRRAVLHGLEVAQGAVELVVGVLADAAGVEHDDVGVVDAPGLHQPVGLQQPGDALRVVLVHLAPEGAQEEAAGLGHGRQATASLGALFGRRARPSGVTAPPLRTGELVSRRGRSARRQGRARPRRRLRRLLHRGCRRCPSPCGSARRSRS